MSISNIIYLVWIVVIVVDLFQQRKKNKEELAFLNKKIELLEDKNISLVKLVDTEKQKVILLLHALRMGYEVDMKQVDEAGIGE